MLTGDSLPWRVHPESRVQLAGKNIPVYVNKTSEAMNTTNFNADRKVAERRRNRALLACEHQSSNTGEAISHGATDPDENEYTEMLNAELAQAEGVGVSHPGPEPAKGIEQQGR